MACGTGFCAGKIIAVLVVASAGGYAAYNYATTGTLFGSCDLDDKAVETQAAETQVAYEQAAVSEQADGPGACSTTDAVEEVSQVAGKDMSGCSMDTDMDPGSCSTTGKTAVAKAADMGGDCTREMESITTEVAAATDICPMTGEPISPEDCPMNGDDKDCSMGGDKAQGCSMGDEMASGEKAESCHSEAEEEVAASDAADNTDG